MEGNNYTVDINIQNDNTSSNGTPVEFENRTKLSAQQQEMIDRRSTTYVTAQHHINSMNATRNSISDDEGEGGN